MKTEASLQQIRDQASQEMEAAASLLEKAESVANSLDKNFGEDFEEYMLEEEVIEKEREKDANLIKELQMRIRKLESELDEQKNVATNATSQMQMLEEEVF